ncbi:lysis system i-spanin subunit Rz, partial [Escherichia coli]|uniref:lysis system i-spanin subunit Rz n=1 Tax=Escherichia coli TaxID=562 RepID=UPI0034D567EC
QIKAVCQEGRESTTASGVDNEAYPRLADNAERDYLPLRERLVMMQAQLEGAQQYITEQCLK